MHSTLGKKSETLSQKKKKKRKEENTRLLGWSCPIRAPAPRALSGLEPALTEWHVNQQPAPPLGISLSSLGIILLLSFQLFPCYVSTEASLNFGRGLMSFIFWFDTILFNLLVLIIFFNLYGEKRGKKERALVMFFFKSQHSTIFIE